MVVSVTSKVGDITPPMKLTHKKPTFKTTQLRSVQNPLWHPVYGLVNRDAAGCLSCLIRIFIELGSTVPISTTWSGFSSLLNSLIPHNHHFHHLQKFPTYLHHPTIHFITNPNHALLTGNASKLPQICIVWSPQNGWHLMIPASSKTSTSEAPKSACLNSSSLRSHAQIQRSIHPPFPPRKVFHGIHLVSGAFGMVVKIVGFS